MAQCWFHVCHLCFIPCFWSGKYVSLVLWIRLYCYQWWYVRLSGQIDFYNVCRGFCLLAVTKAAIRAKLFFQIIDTDRSGTISESEFEVFLKCVNAIDESNYTPEEIKVGLISVHRTLLWKNLFVGEIGWNISIIQRKNWRNWNDFETYPSTSSRSGSSKKTDHTKTRVWFKLNSFSIPYQCKPAEAYILNKSTVLVFVLI